MFSSCTHTSYDYAYTAAVASGRCVCTFTVGGESIVIFVIGACGRIVAKTHQNTQDRAEGLRGPIKTRVRLPAAIYVLRRVGDGVFHGHKRGSRAHACVREKLTAENIVVDKIK